MAWKHLPLLLSIEFLLAAILGCGSSNMMAPPPPPPPSKSEFLYAMTFQPPTTAQLLAFKLDLSAGTLSAPSTTAVPLSLGIVVDPASKFLYLSDGNLVPPAIDIFSIDSNTGSLTNDGAFVLTTICVLCPPPSGPGALAMDSIGKFLYYGSSTFGSVTEGIGALSVTSGTGALNQVPGSPFAADDVPITVLAHPSGHFFYTENALNLPTFPLPLQSVSGFSIDSGTGALAPVIGSPFTPPVNVDLTGFTLDPSGKFMYAGTGSAASGILAWSIDSTTGALTALPASPFAAGATTAGITIDPSGKFLYASNGVGGGILGFTIDAASGALTSMSGSPFDSAVVIGNQIVDPSGTLLVAVDGQNSTITLFTIDSSTGALTPLGKPTTVTGTPLSLVMAKAP